MPNVKEILSILKKTYPTAHCALDHKDPWQLLISTILSAQCTDVRVNMVTPALFKKYPTAKALGKAPLPDVENIIRTTGFFRNKAKSIVLTSRDIAENHGGQPPKVMDELLKLRGVARKTANVVLGSGYGIASGIVVDTHMIRVAGRLGLTKNVEPVKIERDLVKIVPKPDWIWFSHAIITHGRQICKAQTPLCPECPLNKVCPTAFRFPAFAKGNKNAV